MTPATAAFDFPGPGGTAEKLCLLLQPSDDPRWAEAVRRLDPDEALPLLPETISDPRRPLPARRRAVLILGRLGGRRGVAILKDATRDPDEIVRARAIAALAVLEGAGPETGGMLAEAARDPSAFVRRTVARVLATPALPEARALLAQMAAEDPAPEVRRAAQDAARALERGGG